MKEVLPGSFEVRLDGIVDHCFATSVVSTHQIDGPLVDCLLEDLLFSVHPYAFALKFRLLTKLI